jgi:AcrR family transcriptional regulator
MARPANPELREKILKAAAEIIEGCGPDCVTMREVAEKIGYSATTLYLYFKDKSAILRDAVTLAFDDLNDSCDLSMVGPRALDKFRQRCRAYVMWGITHPGHYSLMFELPWEMAWTVDLATADVERVMRGRAADLAVLREAILAGEMRDLGDLDAFEDAVFAALHGATALAISRRLIPRDEEPSLRATLGVASRTADTLVNALIECTAP